MSSSVESDTARSPSSGLVVRRHADFVVEIELDRPQALNAVSTELAREIVSTLRTISADDETRALVLSSSKARAFCVGADLKERSQFSDDDLLSQRSVIRELFASVRELPMPAIAAVQGFALGGGFELALSCDVIIADSTAVFGLTEVTVGLVPGGGGTQLLPRRVGAGAAAHLMLSGRKVNADEAFRLGIADQLVPEGQALAAARDLASAIAANSPIAVRAAKRAGRAAYGAGSFDVEDASWHTAAVSADRREGIAAFAEKRKPNWSGR
ncbi:MAG: enoyl-CoA hydratase/isomerase family protein [Acidothermaceae bacterium]